MCTACDDAGSCIRVRDMAAYIHADTIVPLSQQSGEGKPRERRPVSRKLVRDSAIKSVITEGPDIPAQWHSGCYTPRSSTVTLVIDKLHLQKSLF